MILNGKYVASGTIDGGGSSIQSERLQSWMSAATYKEWINTAKWDQVVEILQPEFRDIRLPTECMCQTVVLIPKGNWGFIGIGLV